MWTCPNCKIEVQSDFDVCWGCGTSRDGERMPGFDPDSEGIMGAEEYAAATDAKRRDDLVTLATFFTAPEAHVVRSRLEAEGIPAVVTDELATSRILDSSASVKVEVPEAQVEQARKIVESIHHTQPEEGRVIAQVVKEGIRAEPSPEAELPAEEENKEPRESPDRLIRYAYRAAILGFFLPFLPFHVYSFYLLIRSTRLSGEPSPEGQRRFGTALVLDLAVILLWWLPIAAFLLYQLVHRLM
jgi:hypothetical protein